MPSSNVVDVEVTRSTEIKRSGRVVQVEGLFDVPPHKWAEKRWHVQLPLDEKDWSIGLILGPSGAGKSAVLQEAFPQRVIESYEWDAHKAIVDEFPTTMSIKEITDALSSVGFSSPPSWLKPYSALSTGEKFRVTLARALAENEDLVALDEFTSVIDRTVAQIGSAAVAKAVRRSGKRFVAATCHFDVLDWLQPDWVYKPHLEEFEWRRLRCRPSINLEIRRVHRSAWQLFKEHHYLTSEISNAAHCYCGFVNGEPAAFVAVLAFPHLSSPGWRGHRTVTLPDFQGVGIGNALSEFIAGCYKSTGKPYRSTTAHPAMIAHRARSKNWTMLAPPSRRGKQGPQGHPALGKTHAVKRRVASFRYVGPPLPDEARDLGILKSGRGKGAPKGTSRKKEGQRFAKK